MDQIERLDVFPLLTYVGNKREQLGLEMMDVDVLRAKAVSQDPHVARKASRLLQLKWDVEPELDALQAESVDINQQLEQFSEPEISTMFTNLVAIQLTEGCNGNCPFCMFGIKKGVTAKYSFDSLETLFRERAALMTNHSFLLYWDSDPFDYRDDSHSFINVYRLYRETVPTNNHYISTAIPLGGEADFIKFMSYMAAMHKTELAADKRTVPVRISLTRQNTQRVETTLSELTQQLLAEGHTAKDINAFYSRTVSTVGRFDNYVLPIGPLIKKADDLKDTRSAVCRDGVVLSPKSCQAIMMTAATIYEPSGQKTINLSGGLVETLVPAKMREEHYATFSFGEESIMTRTEQRKTMLPIITLPSGEEYSLPDKVEDITLKLGREVAALTRLMHNFSKINALNIRAPDFPDNKLRFFRVSVEGYKERQRHTENIISSAEQFFASAILDEKTRKQIEYLILLARTHLAKMDFLADQIEQGRTPDAVSAMAKALLQVGRNEIESLPEVMERLMQETAISDSKSATTT